MRDLSLLLTLAVLLGLTFRFPIVGLYSWVWLAINNPHRAMYFVQDLPLNMVVAAVTIGSWLFSKERKTLDVTPFVVLLGVFAVWISITTLAAPMPEMSTPLWDRNIKTIALVFMVMALVTNRVRLIGMLWTVAVSIGFYGVKGGTFMLATAGNYIVFGPPSTMIEDNNSLALACIIVVPVINYLRQHTQHKLLRLGLMAAMGFTVISVLGSYSRGGLIALAAMLVYLWTKSRAKVATLAVAIMVGLMALVFMPQKYADRIPTIQNASEDSSFQGRLDAWRVAWDTALDRPLGAGFDGPRQDVIWMRYLPDAVPRASHSIYFMVLGEHGFLGFGLYLAMIFLAWRDLVRVLKLCGDRTDLLWASDMARALQVSMIGFMVGGAALPMAYYDGFLVLLGIGAALRAIVERQVGAIKTPVTWRKAANAATPHPVTA